MAHSYRKTVDIAGKVAYEKIHDNGDVTEVLVEETVGSNATDLVWKVSVSDSNGSPTIGKYPTKQKARKAATRWMNNHPKGVTGPGGAMGAVNAMEDATNSIFTGGGRF